MNDFLKMLAAIPEGAQPLYGVARINDPYDIAKIVLGYAFLLLIPLVLIIGLWFYLRRIFRKNKTKQNDKLSKKSD